MRILLVEDDPMIGAAVEAGLRHEGHAVDWARDGIAAELALGTGEYAMALLESNSVEVHIHHLRRKLGADVIRNLRGVGYLVPKTK